MEERKPTPRCDGQSRNTISRFKILTFNDLSAMMSSLTWTNGGSTITDPIHLLFSHIRAGAKNIKSSLGNFTGKVESVRIT